MNARTLPQVLSWPFLVALTIQRFFRRFAFKNTMRHRVLNFPEWYPSCWERACNRRFAEYDLGYK